MRRYMAQAFGPGLRLLGPPITIEAVSDLTAIQDLLQVLELDFDPRTVLVTMARPERTVASMQFTPKTQEV